MRPEQPSDPPLRFATTSSGRVAYTDEGEGPCLVAVHGLPGSVRDWRWLAPALGPDVRLVRLDMPGFGATEHAAPPVRWPEIAQWVLEVTATIVDGPFCVIGHSMGGPQASMVAAAGPDVVRGLALLAGVGLRPHRAYRRVPPLSWMDKAASARSVGPAAVRLFRGMMIRAGFPRSTSAADVRRTISLLAALSFPEHRRAIESLKVPVFGAWADDDSFIEPEIELELLSACPDGPRLRFSDGGHNIQKTKAQEIGSALGDFVVQCVGSR